MKKVFLFSIFTFALYVAQGQASRLDSLQILNQYEELKEKPINEKLFARVKNLEKLSEQINYVKGQLLTKAWIGSYYRQTGQYEKSIEQFQKNISLAKEYQDSSSIIRANLDLSNVYNDINDLEKATEYIERQIELSKETNNKISLCLGLNTLGIIEMKKRRIKRALKIFLESKKISKGLKLPAKFNSTINSNLGVIYVQLGNHQQAIQYFKDLLQFNKTEKDSLAFAPSYGNIAYAYQNNQEFEKAFTYYDSSFYFSEKFGQDEVTYITYSDISDGYKLKGDYKNALLYQKKYYSLYQEVFNEKTKNNIATLEVKFESERKEKELLATQKEVIELEQLDKIRQQRMWIIVGGLIASIIIAFLIYFRAKTKVAQKQIEEKLIRIELKNKELEANQLQSQLTNKQSDLTNLALDIGRKNKFSNQLIKRLDELKKLKTEEVKPQLREVISFAVNHLQINEDLALLQKNVETVNQTFYQNLENKYGKLTANEKYLAGLVRLNLSNKDVAAIRGISTGSAKMSRHRLRKKLGLVPEDDIVIFLQKV